MSINQYIFWAHSNTEGVLVTCQKMLSDGAEVSYNIKSISQERGSYQETIYVLTNLSET